MNRNLISALAAVLCLLMTTPTFAQSVQACQVGEDDESCLVRLKVLTPELMRQVDALGIEVANLKKARGTAATTGDPSEVLRLQSELAKVTGERDRARTELEQARKRIGELEAQVDALSGKVDAQSTELEELKRQFQEFRSGGAGTPVASAEASEPTARFATYQPPRIDPTVYDRMGWVNREPEFPSPMAHPDVPRHRAGNRHVFRNEHRYSDGAPYVFVRVNNVDITTDSGSHMTGGERLLGPGETLTFYTQNGETPDITVTPARESTAFSSSRSWNDRERRHVSVERHDWTCRVNESFGSDRTYELSSAFCNPSNW